MAEQLLKRRPEQLRATTKVTPIPAPPSFWSSRNLIFVVIALGGALAGHLLSQLIAFAMSDRPLRRGVGKGGERGAMLSTAGSAAERLTEVERALQSREFGAALLLAEEALRLYPADQQLQAKRQRAEDEMQNRFRFETFELAVSRHNDGAAMALFAEIPADSAFKFRAAQAVRAVRERLLTADLKAAQSAAKLSQCAEARSYAQAALTLDSGNQVALTLLQECGD
jgi:hypothetical protein